MTWLQLHVDTNRNEARIVEQAMQAHGALSVTLEDNADEPIFEPELGETPLWTETRVSALFSADINTSDALKQIAQACQPLKLTARWEILEDKDWQREWMKHFKPIRCGERFWICPSWTEKPDPTAINLMLDPGLAFGTGTHPTTFLCLQWIAKALVKDKNIVDYGCGSGILGIAALLHGAKSVLGVDIDPQALLSTQENAKRNQLNVNDFPVVFPSKCPSEEFDLVLANILAGPLVKLSSKLIALLKPGGRICLSGILSTQEKSILEAYQDSIEIESVDERDGWICVSGVKSFTIVP